MKHQRQRATVYGLLILVTLAQCIGIVLLHQRESSNSQAAASLLQLEVLANRLDALQWRAISVGTVPPDLQAQLAETRRQAAGLLAAGGTAGADTGLAGVRQAYEAYLTATTREEDFLDQGNLSQAEMTDQGQVDPGFERLALAIAASGHALVDRSEDWRDLSLAGILLSVLIAAAIIAALFRHSEQVQEKARLTLVESNHRLEDNQLKLEQAHAGLQRQAEQTAVLNEIDRAILAAHLPDETARAAAQQIRRLVSCERAEVVLFDFEEESARWVAVTDGRTGQIGLGTCLSLDEYRSLAECRRGEVVAVEDIAALAARSVSEGSMLDCGMRSYLSVPLRAEQRVLGALNLWRAAPSAFDREETAIARSVADSLAVALFHGELYQQVRSDRNLLQALNRKLVEVQEDERRSIARELHDEAGQGLASLTIGLALLEREMGDPLRAAERLGSLKEIARDVGDGLHRLALDLRPPSLDRLGLVPALRVYVDSFAGAHGLDVELTTNAMDIRLPQATETALYRIVQEALTNVSRHAHATHADVILQRRPPEGDGKGPGQVVAIIEDDGSGFDPAHVVDCGRLGLAGMRERAEAVAGRLTVETEPGQGTAIIVEVPCECACPDC